GRGGFGERFVATVAVVTNGRRCNKYARLLFQLRKARDKMASRVDAAAAQNLLPRGSPAAVGNGRAGQMHERVGAFHSCKVDRACRRLPADILSSGTRLRRRAGANQ